MPHPTLRRVVCLSVTSIAALHATALAEDTPVEAPLVFPTLGPDGLGTRVQIQGGVQTLEGQDEMIKRLDLSGQLMSATGNAGGYASVALSTIEDSSTISNVELGGLYRLRGRQSDTALRAGLVLPTASDEDEDWLVGYVSTIFVRPSDIVTAVPDTTSLRIAVAPTFRSGAAVLRLDAGLDVPLDSEAEGAIYHLDLGVAVEAGGAAITGELQTVGSTESGADDTLHVAAIGVQGRGPVAPFATLSFPFASGDSDGFLDGSLNAFAGVRFAR